MLEKLILRFLHYMLNAGTVSFFGIGKGPDEREKQQYGIMSGVEGFGIAQGEKATGKALDFWGAIMSGDPVAISKVLGPQLATISKGGTEAKKTAAEFGNRGGGTNAFMQTVDDTTRGKIAGLIGNLTGTAAGEMGSIGQNLLGLGVTAGTEAFGEAKTMQQQNAAKWDDIFQSITSVASSVLGSVGGAPKAFPNMKPGEISGAYGGPTSVPTTTSELPWSI